MPSPQDLEVKRPLDDRTHTASIAKKYDFSNSSPSSFTQWQAACALVKYLYLRGSYESCIAKSNELIKAQKVHDVHRVFLHFYAGLCHETWAESLTSEHSDFHSQLDGAEQHLTRALQILPVPQSKAPPPHVRQGSYEAFKRDIALQQRSSSESSRPDTDLPSHRDSKSSQTTPASVGPNGDEDACYSGARGRYNRILLSLKPELETHISYIQALRQDSSEAISRSNSHAGESAEVRETMAKIAVKQRVADGRKRNWKRTRFSLIPKPSPQTEIVDEETQS